MRAAVPLVVRWIDEIEWIDVDRHCHVWLLLAMNDG
jgi:hypothetical protein